MPKVYTTYLAKLNQSILDCPENTLVYFVARSKTQFNKIMNSKVIHAQELAPTWALKQSYADNGDITYLEFCIRYKEELSIYYEAELILMGIKDQLLSGKNILICCMEKDHTVCHRTPLAEVISDGLYDIVHLHQD